MLSRNLKRVLLDSRWPLPPTFLLPWSANLTTASQSTAASDLPPAPPQALDQRPSRLSESRHDKPSAIYSPIERSHDASDTNLPTSDAQRSPLALSSSVRQLLPILKSQAPHYITIHIHGRPYLLTQGDTIRLPFLMHDVEPGDVLRFNRAINIGSRDYTLKAAAAAPKLKSTTMGRDIKADLVKGLAGSESMASSDSSTAFTGDAEIIPAAQASGAHAPHFIPHIEQGKHGYLDERLYVCRAVVMGVETEPLRIKEKTKRRQRKIKKVKSKHRFTVLRVKEVAVRSLNGIEEEGSATDID